jgi:hypothetical protein
MNLPQAISNAAGPLLKRLPLGVAMEQLVVKNEPETQLVALVEEIVNSPAIKPHAGLAAGLWLYIDDLHRSHELSQSMKDSTGAFWHGIMHRREGDFSNSHYWFDRAGKHPAMNAIPNYCPHSFIDDVAAKNESTLHTLISKQREEWCALFSWCASH